MHEDSQIGSLWWNVNSVNSELIKYGITHCGILAQWNQQQAAAEKSIHLVKNILAKLCSLSKYGGRKDGPCAWLRVMSTLNSSHTYGILLSRTQLLQISTLIWLQLLKIQFNFKETAS